MIIDGRKLAELYTTTLKDSFTGTPGLAAILIGNNPASKIYIEQKRKKAQALGIFF